MRCGRPARATRAVDGSGSAGSSRWESPCSPAPCGSARPTYATSCSRLAPPCSPSPGGSGLGRVRARGSCRRVGRSCCSRSCPAWRRRTSPASSTTGRRSSVASSAAAPRCSSRSWRLPARSSRRRRGGRSTRLAHRGAPFRRCGVPPARPKIAPSSCSTRTCPSPGPGARTRPWTPCATHPAWCRRRSTRRSTRARHGESGAPSRPRWCTPRRRRIAWRPRSTSARRPARECVASRSCLTRAPAKARS